MGSPEQTPDEPNVGGGRTRLLILATVVAVAVIGTVAWLASPTGSRKDAPSHLIGGTTVKEVLLTGTELTGLLGQPFQETPGSLVYGDYDDMDNSSPPGECVGVIDVAPQAVYRSSEVHSYARQTWAAPVPAGAEFRPLNTKVMFVKEAVVALPSAEEARAVFTKFAEHWKHCDGHVLSHEPITPGLDSPPHLPGTDMHIAGVHATDTMLSASVVLDQNPGAPDTRALGIHGNCLIGVLVAFTGVPDATGSADPATSAVGAVQAMLDKVGKLGG